MQVTEKIRTALETVESLVLTEDRVYVRSNITPVEEPETEEHNGFKGFEYDETEYTKDEFIALQAQQQNDLSAVVDDLLVLMPSLVGVGGAE